MAMPLSTWSIRNPIPPIVLFLVLTISGLISFRLIPVTNFPNIVLPLVSITITQPGSTAEEIENQITRQVESVLAGVQGVKHIYSTVSEGASVTVVEFYLEVPFDRAVTDSRDAVAGIRDQLPKTIQEPIIARLDIDSGALLVYTVEAPEMKREELSWFIDDKLKREFLAIPGLADVQRQGGADHEITVVLNPEKLASYGVSASTISRQLAQTNINLPGGRITLQGTEYSLRTVGNVKSIEALKDIQIPLDNGRIVKLSDLGTIKDGAAEARGITRLEGKPAQTIVLYRGKAASEVTIAELVRKKLEELKKKYPGVLLKELFSVAKLTSDQYRETINNFLEGALLTILVVFLFLRDRRATLIAAIAIPLSIIPTFLCVYLLGFSLNTVSLLGISLVTGVLVDDAIVEIENIHRHMREGKKPYEAAIFAASEIGLAVVATTLVICAVFTPVSFMSGVPGQYFKQFGLTVAIAAFFSLVVARLLTPMLAAYLMKAPPHEEDAVKPGFLKLKYNRLLEWTLEHRLKTIGIAAISMILSLGIIPFIPTGFLPYTDLGQSHLTLEMPIGTTVEQTDEAAQKVSDVIRKHKEVDFILTSVAGKTTSGRVSTSATGGASGINVAKIEIKLIPKKQRELEQRAFENKILPELKQFPDMRLNFSNDAGGKDVTLAFISDNNELLEKTVESVEKEMRSIPELTSVGSNAGLRKPEIIITPDLAKAAELGITVIAISDAIRIATIGDLDANLAKFNVENRQIPIRVRFPEGSVQDINLIKSLKLPTIKGTSVPLSAVASIEYGSGPSSIKRRERQRAISLEANLKSISLGDAVEKIYNLPSMKTLPPEVIVKSTGDAEVMSELFTSFAIAIGLGLLLVYSIQVLLYRDWIQPFTRMVALPLSIGGTFILLYLTGTNLTMPTIIGILMLMGIADKNSILLVDYMLELIRRGVPRREAIIQASLVRARPIIMTSIAMLAGMMPMALGLGSAGVTFRGPMAISVIGGLISSTALSLIFVPVIFSYVRDFEDWLRPTLKKIIE